MTGRRVLITRPAEQAGPLIAELTKLGFEVLHFPVLAIEPLSPERDGKAIQTLRQLAMNLDLYQHVIFISSNAAQYGCQWFEQFWPQWPVGISWHAIGRATAEALAAFGIAASEPGGQMNSESLLAMDELQSVTGQKILIVRGVGGREQLAEALRGRGAEVDYAECYRRALPAVASSELQTLLSERQPDTLVVHSGESLSNLLELLGADGFASIRHLLLVVPGQRVAELADEAGFQQVVVAHSAASADIVAALTDSTGISSGQ